MGSLVALVLALLGAGDVGGGVARCVVPEGPVVAEVVWRGQAVRAREGALEVGGRRLTPCDGLPGPFPSALAVQGDALVVGFRAAGVFRWKNEHFEAIEGLPADGVLALAAGPDAVWIGLGTRGLWRAEGRQARPVKHRILGAQGITALAVDGPRVEVGVGPYGWWRVEGARISRVARGVFAGCFRRDPGGAFGPRAPGVACALGAAAPASGLPSGHVTALAGFGGALYVGTFDQGLARQAGDGFTPVPGSPRFINALLPRADGLWIATPRGLFKLGLDGIVRRAPVALPSDHVNGLASGPDGTLWVATSQGLAGLGPAGMQVWDRARGLPGRIVYAVAVAADGAVWAGTDAGAARIAAGSLMIYDHARGQLPHDWVNALLADGDDMLAGTYDAGVHRLSPAGTGAPVPGMERLWVNPAGLARVGGRLVVSTLGDGLRYAAAAGVGRRGDLPSDDVTAAARVGGRLWIGTRGGLVAVGASVDGDALLAGDPGVH